MRDGRLALSRTNTTALGGVLDDIWSLAQTWSWRGWVDIAAGMAPKPQGTVAAQGRP